MISLPWSPVIFSAQKHLFSTRILPCASVHGARIRRHIGFQNLKKFTQPFQVNSCANRMRSGWHRCFKTKNIQRKKSLKPGSNEDESRWELAGKSLHESFLNSHCLVKRERELHKGFLNSHCSVKWAVRIAWELTRVFLLFPLVFLRFLTLVKLLTCSPSHYSNCHLSMIRNNIFFSSSSSYG